jgi:anaphase-promoting complex subunit 1
MTLRMVSSNYNWIRFWLTFTTVSLYSDCPEPLPGFESPPPILSLLEFISRSQEIQPYQTIDKVIPSQASNNLRTYAGNFSPRIKAIIHYFSKAVESKYKSDQLVEAMIASGVNMRMVETFPEALLAIFKESIVQCQANPPTTWSAALLAYVSREDLNLRIMPNRLTWTDGHIGKVSIPNIS